MRAAVRIRAVGTQFHDRVILGPRVSWNSNMRLNNEDNCLDDRQNWGTARILVNEVSNVRFSVTSTTSGSRPITRHIKRTILLLKDLLLIPSNEHFFDCFSWVNKQYTVRQDFIRIVLCAAKIR